MIQGAPYWLFLSVAVPLYWMVPPRGRTLALSLVSMGYLSLAAPRSAFALVLWGWLFYLLAPVASRGGRTGKGVVLLLTVSILFFLAFFKYGLLFRGAGGEAAASSGVLIPLGISYYTFKLIHYLVESARGVIKDRRAADFFSYLFLVPMFSAGPIERYDHFLENREQSWTPVMMAEGGIRIALGLIKKFLVVEVLIQGLQGGKPAALSQAALVQSMAPPEVWWLLFLTYLHYYLDFSAYSDIAIGGCRLFGIRIMENFHYPLSACSLPDFWRRWHMTLMHWCRSYVYMPLLGLTRRPSLCVAATFLVFGLWHSLSLSRMAWAALNAAGIIVFHSWSRFRRRRNPGRPEGPAGKLAGLFITQVFVTASMALLIAEESGGLSPGLAILDKAFGISIAAGFVRGLF